MTVFIECDGETFEPYDIGTRVKIKGKEVYSVIEKIEISKYKTEECYDVRYFLEECAGWYSHDDLEVQNDY